jgi:hypothetical protein
MGWLFAHDVLPAWTAQDPPRLQPTEWLAHEGNKTQFTILHENTPMGTIWTSHLVDPRSIIRTEMIWIDRLPLDIAATPLRVVADSTFTGDGLLDEFHVELENPTAALTLHGERFHADFSFTLETGPIERAFKVPLTEAGLITDAFQPFGRLADLEAGQTWRMQVFNPVAALTGVKNRFIPMTVSVVGEETIATADGKRRCFVVEAPNARAWVDEHGVVHVQEITLPVTGPIRIVRESVFDDDARIAAEKHTFRMPRQRPRRR